MMEQAIRDFAKQFTFEPVIENPAAKKFSKFVVVGMGGSHLAADLLRAANPAYDVIIHQDYGLPVLPEAELKARLIILNSYSGNTEETLDAYQVAKKKGLAMAVVSVGGKLLAMASKGGLPYIQIPDTGIQPRLALGFTIKALLKLMGEEKALAEVSRLAKTLEPAKIEPAGKNLAAKLQNKIPAVYASQRNAGIAYNWKAKLNETGKTPAFYNVWPELNHNEMTGFDVAPPARPLAEKFHFVFLKDAVDHPRVAKRLEMTKKIYEDRKLPVEVIELVGQNIWQKIFAVLVLADWTAYHLGTAYGAETTEVPLVEEFKKLIS